MTVILTLFYMPFKKIKAISVKGHINIPVSFFICLLFGSILINAHGQKLNYKVISNGNDIGWVKLEKSITGNFHKLTLHSEIKFRILILLTVTVFDSAWFVNGKLIFSSQFHRMNDKVKVYKQTLFTGNSYEVIEDNEKEKLTISDISTNLLSLYFKEPIVAKKVYCDKQECFADIEKAKDGGYSVQFPN